MSDDKTVRDDPDNHRYVIDVGGVKAGYTVYHRRGGRVIFVHTEVDPAFGGQGVGSALARGALDDVRASGAKIVPLCPFIAGWIDKHPDYADLIDHELLARIDAS